MSFENPRFATLHLVPLSGMSFFDRFFSTDFLRSFRLTGFEKRDTAKTKTQWTTLSLILLGLEIHHNFIFPGRTSFFGQVNEPQNALDLILLDF